MRDHHVIECAIRVIYTGTYVEKGDSNGDDKGRARHSERPSSTLEPAIAEPSHCQCDDDSDGD